MSIDAEKQLVRRVFEEAFNQGRLEIIDEVVAVSGVDHQHPDEPSFCGHLKEVVRALREAFPDLHFAVTELIGEGEWVACHAFMTGTQTGPLRPPVLPAGGPPVLSPTGRTVRVPHMYMMRFEQGKNTELWHVMDSLVMIGQLGLLPERSAAHA